MIADVHDERIHAVSFQGDGYGLSFRDHLSDLFHHCGFVYEFCVCHFVQNYGYFCYL